MDVTPDSSVRSHDDVNAVVGGLLRDLAFVQASPQRTWGYKRAAAAVLSLEEPLTSLVRPNRTLPKIAGIGPASTRVIFEVLDSGSSETVEQAVAASGRAGEIARRRMLRANFLSRAEVLRVLARDHRWRSIRSTTIAAISRCTRSGATAVPTSPSIARRAGPRLHARRGHGPLVTGLQIAGGMSMADAARQHRRDRRAEREAAATSACFKGIEANLGADGTLDLSGRGGGAFDLVLAAPHSQLRIAEDQTPRLLRAIRHAERPHPRASARTQDGRARGHRRRLGRGVAAQPPTGVAVEIDGDPIAPGSGLHAGAASARRGLPVRARQRRARDSISCSTPTPRSRTRASPAFRPERIVNCWPLDRLLAWVSSRSVAVAR